MEPCRRINNTGNGLAVSSSRATLPARSWFHFAPRKSLSFSGGQPLVSQKPSLNRHVASVPRMAMNFRTTVSTASRPSNRTIANFSSRMDCQLPECFLYWFNLENTPYFWMCLELRKSGQASAGATLLQPTMALGRTRPNSRFVDRTRYDGHCCASYRKVQAAVGLADTVVV
jgi:hypothetical protein